MVWLWFLFLQLCCLTAASPFDKQKPGCPATCGKVTIPYPFGIGSSDCFKDEGFEIICNTTTIQHPRPFLGKGTDLEAMEILPDQVRIKTSVGYDCYDPQNYESIDIDLKNSPFTFSQTSNKLTAIGCDTYVFITGTRGRNYTGGCLSFCDTIDSVIDGSCSGIGCCQTSIPKGLKKFNIQLSSYDGHDSIMDFNPCSYALLVDQDRYNFSISDLSDPAFYYEGQTLPTVLDWAIGVGTCEEAKNSSDYVCGQNSFCRNYTNGPGYLCSCSTGYEGNPYLEDGCQDVDECRDPTNNPCKGICTNTLGGYNCSCPFGTHGDGERDGVGCIADDIEFRMTFPLIKVITGFGLGLLFLLVGSSWAYWGFKKRKLIRLKEKFFIQNGGLLLQQQILSRKGVAEALKIFTTEELEIATNSYDESQILGRGGYGIVYKGILPNNRVVAIKKSKIVDATQMEQFVNEVVILSQINHRNVVKLLGCCLETQVPLLVYEFVSNGTLFHHIHDEGHVSSLSWDNRLRIAAETAGALAYLHSATSTPVIHRDVKSANILLSDDYTAKVSDFGASRLLPMDRAQVTTLVQGTFGYLDPEYFHTSQLTEKSDVYSFGVVIVELLTGMLPVSFERSQEEMNLAAYFIASMEDDRLFRVLEVRIANEGSKEQLRAVSNLARRCLRLKGEQRPTMKEVAMELEGLRRFQDHPWDQWKPEERDHLLGEPSQHYTRGVTRLYGSESHFILELESGR